MKKFFDEIFKPYIFPIIILILGAFLKAGENLKSLTSFFKESSSSFVLFFNRTFYLWEIILYIIIIFLINLFLKKVIFKKSKEERKKTKAIKKSPDFLDVHLDGNEYFRVKYVAKVINDDYEITKVKAYCKNCTDDYLMMRDTYFQDFECNCGSKLSWKLIQDIKSKIITNIEKNE